MIKTEQRKKTLYIKHKKHTFLNYSKQDKRLCKQTWLCCLCPLNSCIRSHPTWKIKSPKKTGKGNDISRNEKSCSSCPLGVHDLNRGLCPSPVTQLLLHPLAETHRSDSEAKVVCEVFTSHNSYVSQRKQVKVLKLKYGLPRARSGLLSRLWHNKQNTSFLHLIAMNLYFIMWQTSVYFAFILSQLRLQLTVTVCYVPFSFSFSVARPFS